jgi:quercetin dioxygenase-like cupin family protein
MNVYQSLLLNNRTPAVLLLQKTLRLSQMVIGLENMQLFPTHRTAQTASLIVIRGTILFRTHETETRLCAGDFFQIPVQTDHEVLGCEPENIFIITKEL